VPRTLLALACLLACVGCRATPRDDPHRATLVRPGDAERATVFPPRRGQPLPTPTDDPLPALAPDEWRAESSVLGGQPRARWAQPYAPTTGAPRGGARVGQWALGGDGDVAVRLDPSSRVRLGISAGGRSLVDEGYDPGRRSFVIAPGVCFERDL
jgi:hypothetical protein